MSSSKKTSRQIVDDIKKYQNKILKTLPKSDLEKAKKEWKQETNLDTIPNEEINYYATSFNPEEQTPKFNENYLKILKLWADIPYVVKPVSFYEFTENYNTLPEELKKQILDNNTKLEEYHFQKGSLTKSKMLSSVKKLTHQYFEKKNVEDFFVDDDTHKISWFFHKDNDKPESDIYKELIEFIIFRVDDLLRCSKEEGKYDEVKKQYFSNEGAHEFKLLSDYIKDLIKLYSKDRSVHKYDKSLDEYTIETIKVIFTDIYDKIKNKKALAEINKKFVDTFSETYKLSDYDTSFLLKKEEISAFEEFINANDKIEYKILKTFFPLELIKKYFVETENGVKLTEAYKKIEEHEVSSVHNNFNKQIMLGFFQSLLKYREFNQWYWIRNAYDPKLCSYRTAWTQTINNFYTYLFSLNDKTLFPIRYTITPSTNDKYINEDIRINDNTLTIFTIYIKPIFIEDYIFLGITSFVFRDTNNKLFRKYFFYFCDKEKKMITIIDERSNVYKFGNIFQHKPVTAIELTQLVDYSKNNLFAYRFKKDSILPEQYTKTIFFTRIKEEDMTKKQKKVIKALNLEKISFERRQFHGLKYYIIKPEKSIINSMKGGNPKNMLKLKLKLSNDFLPFDRIAGNFYDTFENYTINRYYKNPPKELENLFFFQRVVKETIHLYLYPFSGYQYFWNIDLKIPENNIKPLYEPFTYEFYIYHEIYKLFLDKKIKNILIIGNSPAIIEVLQYNNQTLENSTFFKVIQNQYKKKFDFDKKVDDFIKKHNIDIKIIEYTDNLYNLLNQPFEKHELFVYDNFQYVIGFGNHTSHFNTLNIFVGVLCGLKYTALGGTFIIYLDYIINKNAADIYLICKKYFKTSHLYYSEISNNLKKNGNNAIFKDFQGITDSEFNELIDILKTLIKYYPNGPTDINIYEPEVRARCNITKPIEGPRKPYIHGFLDTDINDKMYDEIVAFNNTHYLKQLDFVERVQLLANERKTDKELLSTIPTNEQIFHSIMYMRKWDLPYNEALNTNKLIQTKIGTQILNDIYGTRQPLVFPFKSVYEFINVKEQRHKEKKRKISTPENINFDVSLDDILIMANNSFNQQFLSERNKYYNKEDTTAYKLLKACQSQFKSQIKQLVKDKFNIQTNNDTIELIEVLNHYSTLKPKTSTIKSVLSISDTRKPFYNKLFKSKTVNYLLSHNINEILDKIFDYNADLVVLQDTYITQKNYFIELLSAMIALNQNGSIILKLKLPITDYPLINLLYIVFDSFTTFQIVKPIICDTEFYIIAKNFNKTNNIDFEYLYHLAHSYDKTHDMLFDRYPEYFVGQFKYVYETIIDNWILQSRKSMFLFDNYNIIDLKTKKNIKKHIYEKSSDWIKSIADIDI